MKTIELLSPAGDFLALKAAIFNGANAIYLGVREYGARAYAKNFDFEELKEATRLAHLYNVKIYVAFNTNIKDIEYENAINYLDQIYLSNADGVIITDISLIKLIHLRYKDLEIHMSTQAGIKDLADTLFYEKLGVDRIVLARELTYDEIKYIKENSNTPLEVFIHGALCVSYSGGCLLSSIIGLRSGNRGRCAQPCRKLYQIKKDGINLGKKSYHLSMKDLFGDSSILKLSKLGIASAKIEGRMKDFSYVAKVSKYYHNILNNNSNNELDDVYHRTYTKGFLNNEDRGNITDINRQNNIGKKIGTYSKTINELTSLTVSVPLNKGDKIRFDEDDKYHTINKIFDENGIETAKNIGKIYLKTYEKMHYSGNIYRVSEEENIDNYIDKSHLIPLDLEVYGSVNEKLLISTSLNGNYFQIESSDILEKATSSPISKDSLEKQLSKLSDTPFYLNSIQTYIDNNFYLPLKEINELRRNLVQNILSSYNKARFIKDNMPNYKLLDEVTIAKVPTLACYVENEMQYEIAKKLGVEIIYFKNYSPYVASKYQNTDSKYVLAGNVGAIYQYNDKEIISDYSFNCYNAFQAYTLTKLGVKRITTSLELSFDEIKNLKENYLKITNQNPNLEIITYGHLNLMTTKYCPLKKFNECGKCQNHFYTLEDDVSKFIITHKNCITHILNEKALNLIDDLESLVGICNVVRLQFSIENQNETERIIKMYQHKLKNIHQKTNYFDGKLNTRGYFKRPVQ